MKFKDSFHPYAMITILFWSLAYVLTRIALRYFSVFALGFLRYAAASAALIVILLITKIKRPRIADFKWFLIAGASGFFLYMITFNIGCKTVTASTSSVVIATVPVMTALLARLIYKENLRKYQWVATAIEFAGVVVLTLYGGIFSVNIGVVWLLLAAALLSVYNLLQRRLTGSYSALPATAFSIFAGTILLGIFLPGSVRELQKAPAAALAVVAALGVFSSAVAYVSWAKAFSKAKTTSHVSNYMFATPFLTTLLGFIITGEKPDLPTVTGGIIILAGILLFNFGSRLFSAKTAERTGADSAADQ